MDATARTRLSAQVLLVGVLAMLWTSAVAFDFLKTLSGDPVYLAGMSDEQRVAIANYPREIIVFWTLNAFAGVAGSVLLLVRSRLAGTMFLLSLLGLMATTLFQYGITTPSEEMMHPRMLAKVGLIWAIAVGLLVYSQVMVKRGALR